MRFPRELVWVASAFVWLAGCDCGGTIGASCASDTDCAANETCVDGRCAARVDAGRRDGAACVDEDFDGICAADDCDDTDRNRGGTEQCDEIDNDCDGNVDEGVAEICRDCEAGCEAHAIPGPGGWMPTDDNSSGVIVDDDGALTLGRNMSMSFSVWVANMDEGTVSKLDSRTGNEVARYPTIGSIAPAGVRPWNEACNWSNLGNCPSRTAVDQNFDAYVANRAFGNQGSVSKIANQESDCIDRNSNGVIDTSRDLNGNGLIEIGTGEFIGPDDECILWTTGVGKIDAWPRALAIGLAPPDGFIGDVWVGLFNQREACRLDPMTGATIVCTGITDFQPYGMAADSLGRIWMVDRSSTRRDVLGYLDTATLAFTSFNMPGGQCATPYGMTIDGAGDVFLANQCDPSIWRYRPSTDTWTDIDTAAPFAGTTRGVAADETYLWVAISHDDDGFAGATTNRVRQYRLSDLSLVTEHRTGGNGPIGVGVSFDGSVWAINQVSNSASRLDPTTGVWTEHTVGLHPYTYSDFIGFGLNVFAEPNGHYAFVVEGCDSGNNRWTGARYTAEVPPGTSVTIYARVADDRVALAGLPWIGPFDGNPVNFELPPGPLANGRYIEIDLRLATMDRTVAPRVFGIDVAGVCEPIIE